MKPPRTPTKTLPFSRDHLAAILPEPKTALESCPICAKIGSHVSRFVKGGETQRDNIPQAVQQLRPFLRLGPHVKTHWVEICPTCSRLYYVEQSYEYLDNGSEDTDSYQRKSPAEILKLPEVSWAKPDQNELHQYENGEWAIAARGK